MKKRLFFLMLAAVLLAGSLPGCHGTGSKPSGDMPGTITAEDLPENIGATGFLTNVYRSAGDLVPEEYSVRFAGIRYETDSGTLRCGAQDSEGAAFYAEFREGAGLVRQIPLDIHEGEYFELSAVGKETFAYIAAARMPEDGSEPDTRLLLMNTADGTILAETALNGLLSTTWENYINFIDMTFDGDGDLIVLTSAQIAVFSPDLSPKRVCSFSRNDSGLLYSSAAGGPAAVVCKNGKGYYVSAPFDKESGRTGDETVLTADTSGYGCRQFRLTDAGETVWRDDTGVWILRERGDGIAEPALLMDWQNSNCDSGKTQLCAAPSSDLLLLSSEKYTHSGTPCLWQSSEDIDLSAVRVIELCNTVQMPEFAAAAVVEFNKSHPGFRIAVKDYHAAYRDSDYTDAYSMLVQDILTGTYRPDIVIGMCGQADMTYFREHGMTLDLGPYIDADPLVSRDNIFGCVQRVFATESGGMWAIPDEFSVTTIVSPDSAGLNGGLSLEDLLGYAQNLPKDMILMQGLTRENAASRLLGENGYAAFVDRESGICSFDGPLFLRWLDFLLSLPADEAELKRSSAFEQVSDEEKYEYYWNGQVALRPVTIRAYNSVLAPTFVFGTRDWTFTGYPSEDGIPGTTVECHSVFAVMNWAEEADEAWEYIRSVVSDGDASGNFGHLRILGMPILKTQMTQTLAKADDYVYRFSFDGSWGRSSRNNYDHEPTDADLDEPGKMLTFLPEDGERLMDFLDKSAGDSSAGDLPGEVREIIGEEISILFSGVGSAKDCAAKIQSRVSIWLAENR